MVSRTRLQSSGQPGPRGTSDIYNRVSHLRTIPPCVPHEHFCWGRRLGRRQRLRQLRRGVHVPVLPVLRAASRLTATAWQACPMIDEFAKEYLHDDLRWIRKVMLWKLDGLAEHDIRRPLTVTGTNLLGLIKHLATWEARYFGEVF